MPRHSTNVTTAELCQTLSCKLQLLETRFDYLLGKVDAMTPGMPGLDTNFADIVLQDAPCSLKVVRESLDCVPLMESCRDGPLSEVEEIKVFEPVMVSPPSLLVREPLMESPPGRATSRISRN